MFSEQVRYCIIVLHQTILWQERSLVRLGFIIAEILKLIGKGLPTQIWLFFPSNINIYLFQVCAMNAYINKISRAEIAPVGLETTENMLIVYVVKI